MAKSRGYTDLVSVMETQSHGSDYDNESSQASQHAHKSSALQDAHAATLDACTPQIYTSPAQMHTSMPSPRPLRAGSDDTRMARFVSEPEDMITGRGEVWVARRLSPDPHAANDNAGGNGATASVWGLETVILPPLPKGTGRYGDGRAAQGPVDSGFAVWERADGHAAHGHRVRGRMHESVVDLSRSVVDDWIVVDDDDEVVLERGPGESSRQHRKMAPNSTVDVVSVAVQETVAEVKKNLKWALDNGLQKATNIMWQMDKRSDSERGRM
jgi:hypothetical protein